MLLVSDLTGRVSPHGKTEKKFFYCIYTKKNGRWARSRTVVQLVELTKKNIERARSYVVVLLARECKMSGRS